MKFGFGFGIGYGSGRKYWPIWVLVSGLSQKIGFGRVLPWVHLAYFKSSCMFLRMFLLSFWRQIAKFKIRNLKTLCVPEWQTKSVVKISWNRCVHGFVHICIIQVMNSKSISSPARLVHQCIDSLFGLVSLQISEYGFKTALPHLEPFLAQLPRELQVNNFQKVSFVYILPKNLNGNYPWQYCFQSFK